MPKFSRNVFKNRNVRIDILREHSSCCAIAAGTVFSQKQSHKDRVVTACHVSLIGVIGREMRFAI
jgi:hypothetical protein